MTTIYIVDTTIKPSQEIRFNSYSPAVKRLEEMSIRAFGQTRKNRMLVLEELGHGYDDPDSINFVRSMAESFNMGVIREGLKMRCDITTISLYQKEEFGN